MKEIGRSGTEAHLKRQVAKAGGVCRKWVSPGRPHVPDQIVIWPTRITLTKPLIHFVETKAPGKKPKPGQAREHARLRKLGCDVFVLDTKEKIDGYVRKYGVLLD
jgi:hypothetical protein